MHIRFGVTLLLLAVVMGYGQIHVVGEASFVGVGGSSFAIPGMVEIELATPGSTNKAFLTSARTVDVVTSLGEIRGQGGALYYFEINEFGEKVEGYSIDLGDSSVIAEGFGSAFLILGPKGSAPLCQQLLVMSNLSTTINQIDLCLEGGRYQLDLGSRRTRSRGWSSPFLDQISTLTGVANPGFSNIRKLKSEVNSQGEVISWVVSIAIVASNSNTGALFISRIFADARDPEIITQISEATDELSLLVGTGALFGNDVVVYPSPEGEYNLFVTARNGNTNRGSLVHVELDAGFAAQSLTVLDRRTILNWPNTLNAASGLGMADVDHDGIQDLIVGMWGANLEEGGFAILLLNQDKSIRDIVHLHNSIGSEGSLPNVNGTLVAGSRLGMRIMASGLNNDGMVDIIASGQKFGNVADASGIYTLLLKTAPWVRSPPSDTIRINAQTDPNTNNWEVRDIIRLDTVFGGHHLRYELLEGSDPDTAACVWRDRSVGVIQCTPKLNEGLTSLRVAAVDSGNPDPDVHHTAELTLWLKVVGGNTVAQLNLPDTLTLPEDFGPLVVLDLDTMTVDPDVGNSHTYTVEALDCTPLLTASITEQSKLRLVSVANAHGLCSLALTVNDGMGPTPDTLVVSITPVNDAPVAIDQTLEMDEDQILTIPLSATDVDDGDSLRITDITREQNSGTAEISSDRQSISYTPPADWNGLDTLHYEVRDGALTDTVAVYITVRPVPDAPRMVRPLEDLLVDEDSGPHVIDLRGVFFNVDSGRENDGVVTLSHNCNSLGRKVAISDTNVFVVDVILWANANGTCAIEVQFTVLDAHGPRSIKDTIAIQVAPVDDVFRFPGDTLRISNDMAWFHQFAVTDLDGDSLRYEIWNYNATSQLVSFNDSGIIAAVPSYSWNPQTRELSFVGAAHENVRMHIYAFEKGKGSASDTAVVRFLRQDSEWDWVVPAKSVPTSVALVRQGNQVVFTGIQGVQPKVMLLQANGKRQRLSPTQVSSNSWTINISSIDFAGVAWLRVEQLGTHRVFTITNTHP